MLGSIRGLLAAAGLLLCGLGLGFATGRGWAIQLWPWPDGPLTYLFAGSILAAIGAPMIWIGWSGELAALRAGALDLALTYAGIAISLAWLELPVEEQTVRLVIQVAAVSAWINLGIYGLSARLPFLDRRGMPNLARYSFAFFSLLLVAVGIALLLRAPHIFPWPLKPETSVLIAWVFFGAAVYFLHGVFHPCWGNARGQLIGFIAYDLILLGPFIHRLSQVPPAHAPSLWVYVAVLIYSLVLAVFLLLGRAGRFDAAFSRERG